MCPLKKPSKIDILSVLSGHLFPCLLVMRGNSQSQGLGKSGLLILTIFFPCASPLIILGSISLLFWGLINMVKIIPMSTLSFCKFYLLVSVRRPPERLYHLIKERTNKRINVIYGMGTGDWKGSGES